MQNGKLIMAMARYDGDAHRIEHFLKVYAYAQALGQAQGLCGHTQQVLETAALVHDIGIKPSLAKYANAAGPNQEKEGPPIARQMLESLGYPEDVIARVCRLVGCHHTYDPILGMDHQILLEADFLVNCQSGHISKEAVGAMGEKVFRTQAGKELLGIVSSCNE